MTTTTSTDLLAAESHAESGILRTTEELLSRISRLPVLDTHEHMATEAWFVQWKSVPQGKYDFCHLMSYSGLDLWLAGSPIGQGSPQWAYSGDEEVAVKWKRMKPYWQHIRTGAYARGYRRTLKIFFDVDDLNDETVHGVSRRIAEYQRPGVYKEYLRERYNIRVSLEVWGNDPIAEPEHFAPIYYFDGIAGAWSAEGPRRALGQETLPKDFGDFRELLRADLDKAAANGAVGLKIGGSTRSRALDFVEHPEADVQESYDFLREKATGESLNTEQRARLKPYQDAAFWVVFEKAGELGLPIQIHSGLEFMQPWDGRPTCLIPSLIKFPDTKFAIFHGSYPHMAELTGLAKSFHNVYLDLAWFHLLSRYEARAWMAEWLDVLPHNKLFAFGGDVFLFFGACSHLEIARENFAAVLARRVADNLCDVDEAEQTARRLFHDNAWETFRMENWQRRYQTSA